MKRSDETTAHFGDTLDAKLYNNMMICDVVRYVRLAALNEAVCVMDFGEEDGHSERMND
jgi:hypothetical protein